MSVETITDLSPEVDPLLNDRAVAALLGVPAPTVRHWQRMGTGPRSFRMNGMRRWRKSAVIEWLAAQEHAEGA